LEETVHTSVEELLHNYGTPILRYAYSFMKNQSDAEDIVQETFLQYIRKAPDFENEQHEKLWLFKVAGNLCRNQLSYNNRHSSDELKEELIAEDREDLSFVWEAVEKLPENERSAIHLFYQEQMTTAEIAEVLGAREGTVRSGLREEGRS
jgi:RNA polymerase sigma factor (sigma-70 family)